MNKTTKMFWTEHEIDDLTAFEQGDEFNNDSEVNAYFTVSNMKEMIGQDWDDLTQSELDNMAQCVIENKWHMVDKPRNSKTGKFLPEGKESQMIRLDKDIADLGREEIQTRVRQEKLKVLVECPECMDPWYLETDNQKPIHKENLYCKVCYEFVFGGDD